MKIVKIDDFPNQKLHIWTEEEVSEEKISNIKKLDGVLEAWVFCVCDNPIFVDVTPDKDLDEVISEILNISE